MPIYEYVCEKCHEHVEVIQKISDSPLTTCPKCDSDTLHKKISQSSFAFKGSGWYVSDYAGKSTSPASSKNSSDEVTSSEKPKTEPATSSTTSGDDTSSPSTTAAA
ncbi:MAG: zinc ribbon domain-containing protein [Acidobacteria bacterium]|nr:zinc ribbon domain-containing protein [Acidobacteriota bacterium]